MIRSSHVGSFPLAYSPDNVKRALKDMARVGLSAPPYPQFRSFIEIYLEPLLELGVLTRRGGLFYLPEAPEARRVTGFRVQEAELAVNYVKEEKLGFRWLRAPVTGVFTLASRVYVKEPGKTPQGLSATALSNKELVKGFFVEFVKRAVEYVSSIGYSIVFLDEPSLTLIVGKKRVLFNYSEEDIVEALDHVAKATSGEVGVHVCGPLHPRILEIVAQVPSVKYISVELHDTPQNMDVVDKSLLEKYDKYLSPGVVSAKKPTVEDVDQVLKLLRAVYEKTAGRVDLVSGDCGFGGLRGSLGDPELEYSVAVKKLEVVAKAVKQFEERTSGW